MRNSIWTAVATTLLLAACQSEPQLETRTFSLQYLQAGQAGEIISPYVYRDREGAPGTLSGTEGALTVRETPDNLDRIAQVLQDFDVPRADIRLHFQLIEADGFTGQDQRIAAVEDELRALFQFQGYRLVGEAFVTATDGSQVEQDLGGDHMVATGIYFASRETLRLDNVTLYAHASGSRLTTTVNIRPGQTLVLGSAARPGEDSTLLLTVRAEEG